MCGLFAPYTLHTHSWPQFKLTVQTYHRWKAQHSVFGLICEQSHFQGNFQSLGEGVNMEALSVFAVAVTCPSFQPLSSSYKFISLMRL